MLKNRNTSDWKKVKLSKLIKINEDSIKSDYSYKGIEYIDISSVGTGILHGTTKYRIDEAPSRAKRLVKKNDTILSTVRPNRRSFLYIKNPKNNLVVSTGFAVLRARECLYPKFLFYLVTNQKFTNYLSNNAKGAAYPAVDTEIVLNAEVQIPSYDTQKKIAYILSAYDDLIESNNRRIKILEEIAQLIYKEWFVKFRFPGHENTKFVDSPFGKIPEGWEVKKIKEILKHVKRGTKIKKQDYCKTGQIPVIDQGKEFIGGYTLDEQALILDLPIVIFGDHTRVFKYIDFPFACGADGTQLLKSENYRMPTTLLYYTLQNVDLSDFSYSRHFKFLKEQNVILPDRLLADRFESIIESMRESISLNREKNKKLQKSRDLLLPKLISGEIEI